MRTVVQEKQVQEWLNQYWYMLVGTVVSGIGYDQQASLCTRQLQAFHIPVLVIDSVRLPRSKVAVLLSHSFSYLFPLFTLKLVLPACILPFITCIIMQLQPINRRKTEVSDGVCSTRYSVHVKCYCSLKIGLISILLLTLKMVSLILLM